MAPRLKSVSGPKAASANDVHCAHQKSAGEISASGGTIYFFRETDTPWGFLSQWYPSPFEVDGIKYNTAEMYMMMGKARTFHDDEVAAQILQTDSPRKHKSLGQEVRGFTVEGWDRVKQQVVEDGTYYKFTRGELGEELQKWLLATGERELVEASRFDRVWGIGFNAHNARANRAAWGENRLGKALMNVRQRIRDEQKEGAK